MMPRRGGIWRHIPLYTALLLALLLAAPAFAAVRAHYRNDIIAVPVGGTFLTPVAGATVYLYQVGTSTPITETIYSAPSGGATLSNPLSASAKGVVEFYLDAPKQLDLYVVRTGFSDQRVTVDVGKAKPVSEYDLTEFGAKVDGVTDDLAALQRARDTIPSYSTLRLPSGITQVSSTIDFGNKLINLVGEKGGSTIRGNVAGPLVNIGTSGTPVGVTVSGITFTNTNAAGIGLQLGFFVTATVRDCYFSGNFIGIYAPGNTFTLSIQSSRFVAPAGGPVGSIGILAGGHTDIRACDVVGFDNGIRAFGPTVNISGCRSEVNRTAFVLGRDHSGATTALISSVIAGNKFEANDTDVEIVSLAQSIVSALATQGSVNSPSGQSRVGLSVAGVSNVLFSGVSFGGSYSDAAIRVKSTGGKTASWMNVQATNAHGTGKLWDMQTDLTGMSFHNCNLTIRPDDDASQAFLQRSGRFGALAAIDYLNANAEGKNLRGRDVSVTQTATTVAVVFTANGHGAGNAAINTATATAGAGLADGTYYYLATAVTARGETAGTSEKTVTLGSGNNQTTLTFFGMTADGFKRRIYRGTATGVYDGYYETALNSNASFVDTGAALARRQSPPVGGTDPTDMREPDANYSVQATPNWGTTVWVTNKATTGFTINFGTAAPASATVDWMIVR